MSCGRGRSLPGDRFLPEPGRDAAQPPRRHRSPWLQGRLLGPTTGASRSLRLWFGGETAWSGPGNPQRALEPEKGGLKSIPSSEGKAPRGDGSVSGRLFLPQVHCRWDGCRACGIVPDSRSSRPSLPGQEPGVPPGCRGLSGQVHGSMPSRPSQEGCASMTPSLHESIVGATFRPSLSLRPLGQGTYAIPSALCRGWPQGEASLA
jgi:hypothetical protein